MIGTAADQTDLHYSLKKAKQNSPSQKKDKFKLGSMTIEDVDQTGYSSDEETTSALAEFTDKQV